MLALLQLLRPKQWIKNGFVIAPIFFAQAFDDLAAWELSLLATLSFIFIASSVYVMNDFFDRAEDAKHPIKCRRPLASGAVSAPTALFCAALCMLIGCALLTRLPTECVWLMAFYIVSDLLYTFWLKRHALLDVFFIASCFVMRVLVGCYAIAAMVSPWIIITTFMLALFLGFGKRYHELGIEGYSLHKQNLQHYNRELLDKLVIICGASTLVCYAIYTAETAIASGNTHIVYTVSFVAFGLFCYLQSLYVYGQGGEPETILLKDKWQWLNISLWLFFTLLILSPKY